MIWLVIYYALLLAVVFVWPTWRLWRRERINAFQLPSDDTAEGVIGVWFKGLIGAVGLMLIALVAGVPEALLGELRWLRSGFAAGVGWALLAASLAWMATAQAQMGRAWRIGIDHANTTALARRGLFTVSRNPIFLGLRLNLLGLLLVVPNAASLAVLLVGEALMQIQVRLEEQHLHRQFGSDYADYRRAVRRWA